MWFTRLESKVSGPYSLEKLCDLRKLGEFSPLHQVSRDKVRWESAAQLIISIDDTLRTSRPQDAKGTDRHSTPVQPGKPPRTATTSESNWYYATAGGETVGPVPESELRQLIAGGQIQAKSQVCREGEDSWQRVDTVEEFSDSSLAHTSKTVAIAVATVTVLLLLAAVASTGFSGTHIKERLYTVAAWLSGHRASRDLTGRITSLDDEDRVGQAVGLVAICERIKWPNGAVTESLLGGGTCFAVTPTGYLLTNRHVAEHYRPSHQETLKIDKDSIQIEKGQPIIVFFRKVRFEADVKHISSRFDLAILKINRRSDQPYFALSALDEPPKRLPVCSLGFPGLARRPSEDEQQMLNKKVEKQNLDAFKNGTTAYVEGSMLDTAFDYSAEDGHVSRPSKSSESFQIILHSARILPGNSGGPLATPSGIVVGVNTEFKNDISVLKGGQILSGDRLYVAYSMNQFRDELTEHIPDKIDWRNLEP